MASSLNHDLTATKESVHRWTLPEATVCTVFVWFEQIDNMGVSAGSVALNCHWKQWNEYTWTQELVWKPWIQSEKTPWTKQHQRGWHHVSHVMKLRKERLSDEVSRIDSTGAGNCARINTFAPLGMQICMMCESVTAHFRMGTESFFQFRQLLFQVFWVRDTASMVLQIARRTSPPFVIVVLVCCGVAPLPIGFRITYKFPLSYTKNCRSWFPWGASKTCSCTKQKDVSS